MGPPAARTCLRLLEAARTGGGWAALAEHVADFRSGAEVLGLSWCEAISSNLAWLHALIRA